MLEGCIKKGISVRNYIVWGLFEPQSMQSRHEELVVDFRRRGWSSGLNHTSPLKLIETIHSKDQDIWHLGKVHRVFSLLELLRRCPKCRTGYDSVHGSSSATTLLLKWNLNPTDHKAKDLMIDWSFDTPADSTTLTFSDTLVKEAREIEATAERKRVKFNLGVRS